MRELARLAGVAPPTITRYEKGDRDVAGSAEVGTLHKIVVALGVRLEWVRTGEEPMEPPAAPPGLPDIFPERGRALQRLAGLLSPEVEASVRGTLPGGERHPTEFAWVSYACRLQREHDEGFAAPRNKTGELSRVSSESPTRRKSSA